LRAEPTISRPPQGEAMRYAIVTLSIILASLLGFVAASCGTGNGAQSAGPVPSGSESPQSTGSETGTGTEGGSLPIPTDTTGQGAALVRYKVWFHRGEQLFVVTRTQSATPRVGTAAMEALLEGPSPGERSAGVGTQIPDGTQLLGLIVDKGIATVDLTSEYESGGGTASMTMRLAQVVCTLDQFPTVKGVLFQLDGRSVDVLGGEGIVIDHPLRCRDYRDLLPVILVTSPAIGQAVSNPVTVSGSANVFEANVTVEIVDSSGRVVGKAFTTATCGSGCRGTFSVTVTYEVRAAQRGEIVVHDDDAAGTGHPPHEVHIPVVLQPAS
jgi:Immunoglobulin-like domain of bacterial spore germination/Sporulation and spore germination